MYTVIGTTKSRALRVLWTLEELGQSYDHIPAGPRSEEARRHNPSGKVPALVVDGTAISDSVAIMTFLADRHGALTFPAGTLERARQDAFTHRINDEIDATLWTAARHSFILPEEMRLPAIKDSLRWEFERSQTQLGEALGDGPFLMGETLTVPDLVLAHCMRWAGNANFPVTDARIVAHRDRMLARPAFQRAAAR
jgi:glutathione S-transferase